MNTTPSKNPGDKKTEDLDLQKNPLAPIKSLGANKKHQGEIFVKARKAIESALSASKAKFKNSFIDTLLSSLTGADEEWTDAREKHGAYAKFTTKFQSILSDKTEPAEKKVERITNIILGYIQSLVKGAKGGRLNDEEVAEARDSMAKNAQNLINLIELPENEALMSAFEWATGKPIKDPSAKSQSLDSYKPKAIATLEAELSKATTFSINDKRMSAVWMIIAFMKPADQMALLTKQLKTLPTNKKKELIETANLVGIIGPTEVGTLLGKTLTKEEITMYAERYKMQHTFIEAGKLMREVSYGTNNQALEMLSGKNLLLFVAQLWGAVTLGANLGVNLFTDERYKDPIGYLMDTPKNVTGVLLPIGVMMGAHYGGKENETAGAFFQGKEGRDSDAEFHAKKVIKTNLRANPAWGEFLTEDGDNGTKAIFSYIVGKTKGERLDPKDVTMEDFLKWLDVQERAGGEKAEHAKLKTRIETKKGDDDKVTYEMGGVPVSTEEFQAMFAAIFTLRAGGEEAHDEVSEIIKEIGI